MTRLVKIRIGSSPRLRIRAVAMAAVVVAQVLIASPALARIATQVAVGAEHRCFVGDAGDLRCAGSNSRGQLGNTSSTETNVPVVGLGSGVAMVSVGKAHTCAVTTTGAAKCWGWNSEGQLGDGTTTDRIAPVDVVGLGSGVGAIAAGSESCVLCTADFHNPINLGSSTCALTTSGGVKCWGANARGQLGDGTTTSRATPVDVIGLDSGIIGIDVEGGHACALTSAGAVKCWGTNETGAVGDGTPVDRSTPVDVVGLTSGVAQVKTGKLHSCALLVSGAVKCWGSTFGPAPSDVPALGTEIATIDAGDAGQVCGVTTAGALRCSGPADDGPVPFLGTGVTAVSVALDVLALTDVGRIRQAYGAWPAGCSYEYGDEGGDSICDVDDPCLAGSSFGGASRKSTLTLRRLDDGIAGNEQLRLSGALIDVLTPAVFADLDPVAQGARVVLGSPAGIVAELVLPGGAYAGRGTAGWVGTGGAHPKWSFTDATGPRGKVLSRATMVDRTRFPTPGLFTVGVTIQTTAATLPIASDDLPLVAHVILGDATAGEEGACGYVTYTRDSSRPQDGCTVKNAGTTLNCQK
jgi:alpha-tubulin suppressor-like RCC1 family protein